MPYWRIAARLYIAVVAAFIAMYVPQAILPELATEFGIGEAQTGLSISALIGSLAIASLFIGPISDRLGRKPVILTATFLAGLPPLLAPFVNEWWQLLTIRSLQGLLIPGILSVAIAYIAEDFPEEQKRLVIGGYIAATVAGGLLCRVLSGIITFYFSWQIAFVFSGLVLLLSACALIDLPKSKSFKAPQTLQASFLGMFSHLKNPKLLTGFLTGFALFFAFIAIFSYLPFYLSEPPFSFSELAIGFVYIVYAAGIVSSPLAGYFAKRFGLLPIILLGLAILIAANVVSAIPNTTVLIVSLTLITFGNFIAQSGATSYVATEAMDFKAGASALYLFCYYIGGGLGAYVPGLFWDSLGWNAVLICSLSVLVVATVMMCLLFLKQRSLTIVPFIKGGGERSERGD